MSQQSKGGQNFPNYLDVPLQSQQLDELDDIIDMLINAGLDLRGSPDFKEEADFIKGKAGYAKAYKQRLLSWRDRAIRKARLDELKWVEAERKTLFYSRQGSFEDNQKLTMKMEKRIAELDTQIQEGTVRGTSKEPLDGVLRVKLSDKQKGYLGTKRTPTSRNYLKSHYISKADVLKALGEPKQYDCCTDLDECPRAGGIYLANKLRSQIKKELGL